MCRPALWLWGLIPVVFIAAMAYFFAVPNIEAQVGGNAETALAGAGHAWAGVSVDGRDVTLHGTAPTQEALDGAVEAAKSADGVRSVNHDVIVRVAPGTEGLAE